MSVGRIILYAVIIWVLYNLIFKFFIPIYRATRKVKKQFSEMREKMDEQMRQQQGHTHTQSKAGQNTQKPSSPKPAGDYIDFEEIK
jgi:uncharacterized membrane protein (DUF106 family)